MIGGESTQEPGSSAPGLSGKNSDVLVGSGCRRSVGQGRDEAASAKIVGNQCGLTVTPGSW